VNRDGTIRCEYQVVLPRMDSPSGGVSVWGRASGVITGRAVPASALAAFDPSGQRPFEAVAGDILQNVRGWLAWAVGEVYGRWVREGDLAELASGAPPVVAALKDLVGPQFAPWSFQTESLDFKVDFDPQALGGFPPELRARMSGAAGPHEVPYSFTGDIPPFQDPATRHEIKIRCNVQVTFSLDPAAARAALDPAGQLAPERLEREALAKAEEWFWYGVKQSFYNWFYDSTKPHRRFVREYSLIHPDVLALCQEGLAQHGITVAKALVRYEAMDSDSAWALTAPGQSGAGPAVSTGGPARITPASPHGASGGGEAPPPAASPRGASDQAMAATIAIMDVNDLPLPGLAKPMKGQPLPPIEEAVWRHQKGVMKDNPGLDRAGCAKLILQRLKGDGYSMEERKRLASIIGGSPNDVVD
jgi:hypothetical protein